MPKAGKRIRRRIDDALPGSGKGLIGSGQRWVMRRPDAQNFAHARLPAVGLILSPISRLVRKSNRRSGQYRDARAPAQACYSLQCSLPASLSKSRFFDQREYDNEITGPT
jgi:hypothetical protein